MIIASSVSFDPSQSLDLLCGVFGNYLHLGADGVGICCIPAGSVKLAQKPGPPNPADHDPQIVSTIGNLATSAGTPRVYALDRHGGYAHNEGHGSSNNDAPLPVELTNDQAPPRPRFQSRSRWRPMPLGSLCNRIK